MVVHGVTVVPLGLPVCLLPFTIVTVTKSMAMYGQSSCVYHLRKHVNTVQYECSDVIHLHSTLLLSTHLK